MIALQLVLYCLLFTVVVKLAVVGGAINGLFFYPKAVQERAIKLGLSDRETVNRKRRRWPCCWRCWGGSPGFADSTPLERAG